METNNEVKSYKIFKFIHLSVSMFVHNCYKLAKKMFLTCEMSKFEILYRFFALSLYEQVTYILYEL